MIGVYPYEDFSVGYLDETPAEAATRLQWPFVRQGRHDVIATGRAGEYLIRPTPTGPRALPLNGAKT